ncbi:hypothetical protein [Novosphingobium sp.]|uniref:hypothetical protein n=1 Tax=Novosphingobium sp. TaxID=1874826 RepID=UPI00261D0986|nr:hypothetical protein [Novosphingobium sp.]
MDEPDFSEDNPLGQQLEAVYGPLMTGPELWRTLGFRSSVAFRKARSRGQVGIRVFNVPGRRGSYAFTSDVAAWLAELKDQTATSDA